MPFLKPGEIKVTRPRKTETVHVSEWGGDVLVGAMTAKEWQDFQASRLKTKGRKQEFDADNFQVAVCIMCLFEEDGKTRMFSEADTDWLSEQPAAAINQIFAVASRLSAITQQDLEDIAKNSETAPMNGSLSH